MKNLKFAFLLKIAAFVILTGMLYTLSL